MAKDISATPKGTVTLRNVGAGIPTVKDVSGAGTATFKWKRDAINASLAVSDQTVTNVKTLKDVVATVDYKLPKVKGTVLNTKFEAGPKLYTVGATWDGKVANKAVTQKLTFSNKDNKAAGETTVSVAKDQKANVVYNQSSLVSAKYTLVKDDFTYEPSYNFQKKSPAVSIAKKQGKDNFKVSYDLKSENASVEWSRKPFKVTASSTVSRKGSVSKPTVAATFENVYEF